MTHPVEDPNERRWLQLSALCDGEADAAEAQASFDGWRDDAALRQRWHAYQWIGDAMRSDDLASEVEHDQSLLVARQIGIGDPWPWLIGRTEADRALAITRIGRS